ncbi:MAG: hypothetical protein O4861_01530 [Trichodesmium sp. St16_bin4-tuft]|nr:hypothetical protein [Trichodesmium sp. St16_bin4-tuft]
MTKVQLKGQEQLMYQRPEDLRELFKGILSDDFNTHKEAKNKLSKWLWKHPKIGMVVRKSFSRINFDDSQEFYNDSLVEVFFKFDLIVELFLKKNQITLNQLDDISEKKLSASFIKYFNRAHYNKACDLYRKFKNKREINGQIIISLDQVKKDENGQEYKTVGDEITDHKNLNDLDNFNLGDFSEETIDNLPIFNGYKEKLRNCSKKVDCWEILRLKCQGFKQTEIAEKLGVHQSKVSRNWNTKCLECVKKIIGENNLDLEV